jgi:hypothetical protein
MKMQQKITKAWTLLKLYASPLTPFTYNFLSKKIKLPLSGFLANVPGYMNDSIKIPTIYKEKQ